jgi:hypothetical protein
MPSKDWIWTDHIKWQMEEREIPKELVENILNNPDEIVSGKHGRIIYQKIISGKLIRVITEDSKLLTVYLTDKIKKYMREERI